MRLIVAILAIFVALSLSPGSGIALEGDDGNTGSVGPPVVSDDVDDRIVVVAANDGSVEISGVAGSGGQVCSFLKVRAGELVPSGQGFDLQADVSGFIRAITGDDRNVFLYRRTCRGGGEVVTDYTFVEELPPVDVVVAARDELAELLPEPVPTLSPRAEVNHLVGLATWVWLEGPQLDPVEATASVPGFEVFATATPSLLTLDPGDGSGAFDCSLFSVPYSADVVATDEHCTHVFEWVSAHSESGVWDVEVSLLWDVSWVDTDGGSGTADPITTQVVVPLTVVELQARVVSG